MLLKIVISAHWDNNSGSSIISYINIEDFPLCNSVDILLALCGQVARLLFPCLYGYLYLEAVKFCISINLG